MRVDSSQYRSSIYPNQKEDMKPWTKDEDEDYRRPVGVRVVFAIRYGASKGA
jgi:hypothetical protein